MRFAESEEEGPATILFAKMPFQYLADTAPIWASRGVKGFMLAGIMRNWDSDVWQTEGGRIPGPDNPTLRLLREMNRACRADGVDRNFIKVAFYTRLPDWFDDDGWASLAENFRQAATLARLAGFRGVAVDIEYINEVYELSWTGYGKPGYPLEELPGMVRRRGEQIVYAMLDQYPDMEVLHLPQSPECYGRLAADLFAGMLAGMARRSAPGGLHLLTEATYQATDPWWLLRYHQALDELVEETIPCHALPYWKSSCSISFGLWPLGYYRELYDEGGRFLGYGGKREKFGDRVVGSTADKSENYGVREFREQFAASRMVCKRYVWIYCHGSTLWQLGPDELSHYGGSESDGLPVIENLDEYLDVLRRGDILDDGDARWVADKLRLGERVDFLSQSGSPHEWLLNGPFDNSNGIGFQRKHPPEECIGAEARPDPSSGWMRARVSSTGYVDLARHYRPPDYRLAYAFCTIRVPRACSARMLFGSDDGARIWLNGRIVHELDVIRGATPDQDSIPLRLRKGVNSVLLKVVNHRGTWGFYLRIVDPEGRPIEGLEFSA